MNENKSKWQQLFFFCGFVVVVAAEVHAQFSPQQMDNNKIKMNFI